MPPNTSKSGHERCLRALAINLQLLGLRARGFCREAEEMPSALRADIAALLNRANPGECKQSSN